ncbi:MAG: histidine phosphatase family protein [Planctomycetota bacterium]
MTHTRRQILAACAAAPVLTLPATACESTPEGQSGSRRSRPLQATLVLVRHTEKDTDDAVDPSLSKAGVERAKDFARTFGATGVTALVHTQYKRTRDTLAPLAKACEVEMEEISAQDMEGLLDRLQGAGPDEVIAVAGHSNTIPAIAYAFGADLPELDPESVSDRKPFGNLPHGAYDRVHVLTPGGKTARLVELRYGAPS